MNFTKAKELFETARNKETGKPIANNTRIIKVDDKTYAVRLHETNVVTFHKNGKITLDSGGWRTHTTKERMNDAISEHNFNIIQDKGLWYIGTGWNDPNKVLYEDGIVINTKTHKLQNAPSQKTMTKIEKTKKKVDKLVSKYIKGYIAHIKEHGLQDPSGGDCWHCLEGDTLGFDHYLSHFEEQYYVPRMLANAIVERKYKVHGYIWEMCKKDPNNYVGDILRAYFRKRKQALVEELMKNNV